MTDRTETPIAWRMTAIIKRPRYTSEWCEDFADEVAAIHRKRCLQAIGHVATVTPVYLAKVKSA